MKEVLQRLVALVPGRQLLLNRTHEARAITLDRQGEKTVYGFLRGGAGRALCLGPGAGVKSFGSLFLNSGRG